MTITLILLLHVVYICKNITMYSTNVYNYYVLIKSTKIIIFPFMFLTLEQKRSVFHHYK
jgi:hypothetical protein